MTQDDSFEAGITLERASFNFKAENFKSRFVDTKNITVSDEIIAREITGDRCKR